MNVIPKVPRHNFLLLPLLGMGLFVILYVLAAIKYPGGSWIDATAPGFSFWHNYLCDLLDYRALNGELNSGRYYARASLGVLCLSLIYLWLFLPHLFPKWNWNTKLMWVSGILAFLSTMLLSSGTHDVTVRVAGLFGAVALLSAFAEMWKAGYIGLMRYGFICLFIFLGNYYIYETGKGLFSLPLIQKITFSGFIAWFIWVDLILYKRFKNKAMHKVLPQDGLG
ncbi:hypothetical protein [Lentiprolixibacter aurantiacus]|uniref:DUF998 domain-containing protein n=1 Tax=Lentiprolixibacter aurantiacus TaxID=2993939 RepID=A0AAE3MP40_9FLAO|nr:hypothetical protein [Lentiprolixibacter aurantiacus]MCX2720758.1 hypothetical protein [Lentiprolixibacter aurantiacus]